MYERVKIKDYQAEVLLGILRDNSIIFLETGLGKTLISILLMFYILSVYRLNAKKTGDESKNQIIFLTNTVQLGK